MNLVLFPTSAVQEGGISCGDDMLHLMRSGIYHYQFHLICRMSQAKRYDHAFTSCQI